MSNIVSYEDYEVRRVWVEDEQGNGRWYFAVVDVIELLTDSKKVRQYWLNMQQRSIKKEGVDLKDNCLKIRLKHRNNRSYETDCADVEWLFRIIQAIPSPKAEPIKQWLAQSGRQRLEEENDPDLTLKRMRQSYLDKGYSKDWVESRIQGIVTRNELTDEWKQRGVEPRKFGFLTSEISKGTFNIKISEHKTFKGLKKRDNLRDNMTRLELLFTMLGEEATAEIARTDDAQGFGENLEAAKKGGQVAGDARRLLEAQTGKPVLSSKNFLDVGQEKPLLEDGDEDVPF
ncbi:MAG: BRO family protein [Chloroflexota bacterium]